MVKIATYDKENDILAVHNGFSEDEKFKGNIEVGDLVLDLSTKMRIRGIEIMNASEYLKDFLKLANVKKNVLEHLKDVKLTAAIKGESITIGMILIAEMPKREVPARIAVPISAPVCH